MKINYASLDRQYLAEESELRTIFEEVFSSGQFVLGQAVNEFENNVAKYCKVKHCIGVNSGTDALILAMKAAGIEKNDEVITPPNSFIASTSTIVHLGAKPVFVDVDENQNISPDLIEKAITCKTKAIMPVHLTGRIAAMQQITEIAKKHNLLVIEDAAQSFASRYYDKPSGSFGDIACFSAHPLKAFNSSGDAGFILTNNDLLAEKIKRLRNHGLIDRNTVKEWSVVSRLDSFKAAILNMRLKKVDNYIKKRRENVSLYRKLLNPENVFIPKCENYEYNSFQTFVIQVSNRNGLQKYLNEKGIQTSIHYPIPIHLQPAAASLGYKKGDFPVTEKQADRILSLPVSQFLSTEEIEYIGEQINGFFSSQKPTSTA